MVSVTVRVRGVSMNKLSIILLCCVTANVSLANNETYYDNHENGWHWYDDPVEEKIEEVKPSQSDTAPPSTVSATDEMKVLQKILEEAKNKAVLYPTEENIVNYVEMQNQVMNNSRDFAKGWQSMLLNHPELNFQVSHPTNQIGRQVYLDQKSDAQDQSIHEFFKDKGLYFFFRSTCPYCQKFAPILKDFADKYQITVLPISLDGIGLREFPDFKTDQGQAQKFNVTVEPSLFVVDPKLGKAIPVSYGLMSEDALQQRIYDIATQFNGEF